MYQTIKEAEPNEPEIKAVKWPLLSLGQDRIEQPGT